MKRIILATVFILTSIVSSIAAPPITNAQNNADIIANKAQLTAKIQELQAVITSNNAQNIEAKAVEVRNLMRTGMKQINIKMDLASKSDQAGINVHYLKLETALYEYTQFSKNAVANASLLINRANLFMSDY